MYPFFFKKNFSFKANHVKDMELKKFLKHQLQKFFNIFYRRQYYFFLKNKKGYFVYIRYL